MSNISFGVSHPSNSLYPILNWFVYFIDIKIFSSLYTLHINRLSTCTWQKSFPILCIAALFEWKCPFPCRTFHFMKSCLLFLVPVLLVFWLERRAKIIPYFLFHQVLCCWLCVEAFDHHGLQFGAGDSYGCLHSATCWLSVSSSFMIWWRWCYPFPSVYFWHVILKNQVSIDVWICVWIFSLISLFHIISYLFLCQDYAIFINLVL